MNVLAYDTSSRVLTLALSIKGRPAGQKEFSSGKAHSEALASETKKLLAEHKLRPDDVDCLVVGLGPGSFTGIRFGSAFAKTFAYTTNCRLIGISGLEAIAMECGGQGRVAVALDARRENVYSAIYEKNADALKVIEAPALAKTDVFLKSLLASDMVLGPQKDYYPKAEFLLKCAKSRLKTKKFDSCWKLEPLYLYPKDCNVTLSKK